jgi:hypothetical protein
MYDALLLNFMQRVYVRHWKRHPTVEAAWTATEKTYGRPFRSFYGTL